MEKKPLFQFRSYELFSFVELLLNFNEHFKTTTSHDNKMLYINRNSSGAINFNYAENKTKFSHNIPPERCKELALFVCAQAANAAGMSVTDMMNVLKVTR